MTEFLPIRTTGNTEFNSLTATVDYSKHHKAVVIIVYPSIDTGEPNVSPTLSIMQGHTTKLFPMTRLNQKKVDAIRSECFEALKANKKENLTDFEASALATFNEALAKNGMNR